MPGIYFPSGEFADNYYSPHLSAMHEPSLFNVKIAGVEIYRFLWLRTFDRPMAVRVQNRDGELLSWSKQLNGRGGYEPGELVINTTKSMTALEWTNLTKYIERASFWALDRLKLERAEVVLQELHVDGIMWVLEGVKNEQYHYVDRCSSSPNKIRGPYVEFYECCLYLLELSGMEIDITR